MSLLRLFSNILDLYRETLHFSVDPLSVMRTCMNAL